MGAMVAVSASVLALDSEPGARRPVRDKPNVLFVLTDDQGYGDLSAHGHPYLKTPNLDRLRAESVRFDNFYVSPSCAPTRAALMTGMHEFKNGVTHTIAPREHLSLNATTVATVMRSAGYKTGIVFLPILMKMLKN